jgi:YrbI family 3-deoxy-D-manno-octulosonate 8-phosphate phosphatase|tara:strand:+ start:293 stop:805 length:513 start_codon:yes stop_codon:yes gene_type:complete
MNIDKAIESKAKKIKLIATDIDGVWTDSKMYYTSEGSFMKSFSTYDGMGTSMLLKNNFIVAMITSEYENINILKTRAAKLKIKEVYYNEQDKLSRIKYLSEKYNLTLSNIAYIGDDLNDLDVLKNVGLSAMPPTSPILDMFTPDIITKNNGGDGAFRNLSDIILKAQNFI